MKIEKYVPNRRNFLKTSALTLAGAAILPFCSGIPAIGAEAARDGTAAVKKKPLVVYYSESGNTKKVADMIHNKVGGDIIRIEAATPYPDNYDALTRQAKKEQTQNARPAIKTKIPNIDEYDVIFLGYPNWWSSMPMPVFTFIEQNKLDGRTIAPFTTHGGGGLGHSIEDLKKECPKSKILKPLAVPGSRASGAAADVEKWLEGLGTALIETTTGNTKIYPDGAY
ncbi:MAG: twin-arginine translocation signal domain-containing protein [Desulfovibrio sp.]